MKKLLWTVSFLAVTAGSVGAGALSNITMRGSDTLSSFSLSVISTAVCPAAVGILYQASGSSGAETILVAGSTSTFASQTVAPMSRFLLSPVCAAADPSKAEGIAFGAESAPVLMSKVHAAACQTAKGATDCSATPNSGLKQSGTLANGTYTLGANSAVTNVAGWQDVLRLIYLGLPNTTGKNPGDQNNTGPTSLRDCNSAARQDLVNHWGNLFENGCEASGGNCTQLTHAFRRDLSSRATDIFRELINGKLYPFCNARFAGDTTPSDYPTVLTNGTPIFDDPYQDFDPIRRVCAGGQNGGGAALPPPITNADGTQSQPDYPAQIAEQVCSPKGTLGLVLTILPPTFPGGAAVSDLYPTKPCLKGALVFGAAPRLPGTSKSTLCPNGDVTLGNSASDYDPTTGVINNSSNVCLIPAASDGDPRCINGKNNFNAPLDPPFGVIPAAQRDGRVFNLHLYSALGAYRSDALIGAGRNVVGNFSRIHGTRTLLASGPSCPGTAGDGRCCDSLDAGSQIGCLVQANPCVMGFANLSAQNAALQTSAAAPEAAFGPDIEGVQETPLCFSQGYPLADRTYLNTVVGFENVTGQEFQLAKCFAGSANGFNALLAASDLAPLSNGPVCQDFPQEICENGGPASDACANNPPGIPTQH